MPDLPPNPPSQPLTIRNRRDFWAGLMFTAFGLFFLGFGSQYTLGSAAKMGPGYFPAILGTVLSLLGIAIGWSSLSRKARIEPVGRFSGKTLVLVLGPVVLFGLLLRPLGLMLDLVMLVVLSSLASHEFRWRATLLNALTLSVLSYVVFVWALKLQFPLWPSVLGY